MAKSGDSGDNIESVYLGESGVYDRSGEYCWPVGPGESDDSGDPCDTYESIDEHGADEQDSRWADADVDVDVDADADADADDAQMSRWEV